MKRIIGLTSGFVALAGLLVACGGSASETPWPAEPDDVDLGPIGESQREEDSAQKPNGEPADSTDKPETPPEKPVKKVDPVAP